MMPSPLRRLEANPIITRDAVPGANSIFNSAVVPFGDGFRGVFRVDDQQRRMRLHAGHSADGLRWEIEPEPIQWQCDIPAIAQFEYGYDPRITPLEGRHYITWCNGYHGPGIGLAVTDDFATFTRLDNPLPPCNRNAVLFPRRINGEYVLLHRPSDMGHTAYGDIFLCSSPDLTFWGKHRRVMGRRQPWEGTKIGAGPVPIETPEGWLLIYHGVLTSCNGYVYAAGAALLDLDEPWRVLHRAAPYLLAPRELYECVGDVPNVVFPCAAVVDEASGRLTLYYGCADTCVSVAECGLGELIAFVKANRSAD